MQPPQELEALKVIDRTELGRGPVTYHLAADTHGHLVCEQCGSQTEVPGRHVRQLRRSHTRQP